MSQCGVASFALEGVYKCEIDYRSLLQNIVSFHIQHSKCLYLNVEWPLLLAKVYTNVRYGYFNAARACVSQWCYSLLLSKVYSFKCQT